MPTDSDVTTGPSRRTLLGAAWAAPVILFAVAAPAASATIGTPEVLFTGFRANGNNFITVSTYGADGNLVGSPFAFQGQLANNTWTNILSNQTTAPDGFISGTLPDAFIGTSKAVRILASIGGVIYFSAPISVPFPPSV